MARTKSQNTVGRAKRHGKHQKHTKSFVKVYWPYLPMLAALGLSLLISGLPTHARNNDVLAYATNITSAGLLDSTNARRLENNVAALTPNAQLDSAAASKANDMVAKDYWSHVTPGGDEPWIFIDNTGYNYYKAGENLAYGFLTSDGTVSGWMNSQSHRNNLLDPDFDQVGFGFANSSNFINEGQETIVVALYADATAEPVVVSTNARPTPVSGSDTANAVEGTSQTNAAALPLNTTTNLANATPARVTRIDALTDGRASWAGFAIGLLSGVAITLLLAKHGYRVVRHFVSNTEKFVLHHPLLDATVISFLILGYTLTRVVGVIL